MVILFLVFGKTFDNLAKSERREEDCKGNGYFIE
jgi:hypothetical protein